LTDRDADFTLILQPDMSTPLGKESLAFFLKTGSFAFGIGYGTVRCYMLQRKENRIQRKQDAAAKSKAAADARRAAKNPAPAEGDFFADLFKEEAPAK
jgi:hypothetical protein